MVSAMSGTALGRQMLLLLLLVGSACKSGAHEGSSAAMADGPEFPCKRMAFGDLGATLYECPDAPSAMLCASQSVVLCRPTNRTRGTVAPGGACRRGTFHPDAKGVFELGDNCALNPRFASGDTPKGSVCVNESGAGPYCTHNCETSADCADVVRDGFFSDCRGGGCLLIRK